MKMPLPVFAGLIFLASLSLATPSHALSQKAFSTWLKNDLRPQAMKAGISVKTFDLATKRLKIDSKMPDLANAKSTKQRQSEFRAPGRYFNQKSISTLAKLGAARVKKWQKVLAKIEKRTGVPRHIIVAIWGRESGFGRVKMPKNAIRSLATSAFAGRRKKLFRRELIAALKIIDQGHVTANQMGSSWAGALGQPQFLPSKFFEYAVDEDGDGRRNIWTSVPDTLGSIGNYLAKHGWQRGRDWGFEVSVPSSVSCSYGGPDQGRAIQDWANAGVTRINKRKFPNHELKAKGYLLFPGGRYGPSFATTPNFYVLKKYNESDVYALFVGHLADRMAGGKPFVTAWKKLPGFNRSQVKSMQEKLIRKGYDVGGADGLIGYKSRNAIGKWQGKMGLAATCFPDRKLIKSIR